MYISGGAVAFIDTEDVDKVLSLGTSWYINPNGYVWTSKMINRQKYYYRLHRFILGYRGSLDVDHINGDKLDNRKSNLRLCTRSENLMNRHYMSNNTSGYLGVTWDKSRNKWQARIKIGGKQTYLGRYRHKQAAIDARRRAEKEYFGEYAVNEKSHFPKLP